MRGYSGIMSTSCNQHIELNGNGDKVHHEPDDHHRLWEAHTQSRGQPLWHLRVRVLRDQCLRGDCPAKSFEFKTMQGLQQATTQLEAAFSDVFRIRKCGLDTPDAMGGRVNDGRSENVTIEFETEATASGWGEFLATLQRIEGEWKMEGVGASVL
ncbi:hypothetical protein BJ875DRAFT_443542 [Amylocarpus encephaloides]|uniref:Uncharacterized protein n=1 Tax=Amylocarpus encephaloides TaxID=45428 RepID=A0A9P7YE89_9HELO|nr:hypothetical protein BJ875DRAFT_443542 [Amylocarpus encephaloides]